MNIKEVLSKKVNELEQNTTDSSTIITVLQEIGEILVRDIRFETKDHYIYPLLVEAYYYREDVF